MVHSSYIKVEQIPASLPDYADSVNNLFLSSTMECRSEKSYVMAALGKPRKYFVQVHFGAAAERILYILPVQYEDFQFQILNFEFISYGFLEIMPQDNDVWSTIGVPLRDSRIFFRMFVRGLMVAGLSGSFIPNFLSPSRMTR